MWCSGLHWRYHSCVYFLYADILFFDSLSNVIGLLFIHHNYRKNRGLGKGKHLLWSTIGHIVYFSTCVCLFSKYHMLIVSIHLLRVCLPHFDSHPSIFLFPISRVFPTQLWVWFLKNLFYLVVTNWRMHTLQVL